MKRLLLSHVLACYVIAMVVVSVSAGAHLYEQGWPRSTMQWADLAEGRATLLVGAPLIAPLLLIWQTANLLYEHSAAQIPGVAAGWLGYLLLLATFDWWLARRGRLASSRLRRLPLP